MATNETRSLRHELGMGMTDGKYKKTPTTEGRGGIIDPATRENRMHLSDTWYGVNTESHVKVAPDGTRVLD